MSEKTAQDPEEAKRRASPPAWRKTLLIGVVGVVVTPAIAAIIQYTQWYFQNRTTQSEAYAVKLVDAERLINDIIYKRYWRTKEMFDSISAKQNEANAALGEGAAAVENNFRETELNFRDQESFLRSLLAIYVDLPQKKDVSNKREIINEKNPDCIKANAFEGAAPLDKSSASDVLQVVEHCHFLVTEGINRIKYLKQNQAKDPKAQEKIKEEINRVKVRLDQLWYIQDILMCLMTENIANAGGVGIALDCDKDYQGQREAFSRRNKELGFEEAESK